MQGKDGYRAKPRIRSSRAVTGLPGRVGHQEMGLEAYSLSVVVQLCHPRTFHFRLLYLQRLNDFEKERGIQRGENRSGKLSLTDRIQFQMFVVAKSVQGAIEKKNIQMAEVLQSQQTYLGTDGPSALLPSVIHVLFSVH